MKAKDFRDLSKEELKEKTKELASLWQAWAEETGVPEKHR